MGRHSITRVLFPQNIFRHFVRTASIYSWEYRSSELVKKRVCAVWKYIWKPHWMLSVELNPGGGKAPYGAHSSTLCSWGCLTFSGPQFHYQAREWNTRRGITFETKYTTSPQHSVALHTTFYNNIQNYRKLKLDITTMPIPSKWILLRDVEDRFSKGGMNLCLR